MDGTRERCWKRRRTTVRPHHRLLKRAASVGLACTAAAAASAQAAGHADAIITGARIRTGDGTRPHAGALATRAAGEDDIKGAITPGRVAHFVILDRSPFDVDPDRVRDIRVLRTVVGGNTVFSAPIRP